MLAKYLDNQLYCFFAEVISSQRDTSGVRLITISVHVMVFFSEKTECIHANCDEVTSCIQSSCDDVNGGM